MRRESWLKAAVSVPTIAVLMVGAAGCKPPTPGPSPSPSGPSASPKPSSSPSSPAPSPSQSSPAPDPSQTIPVVVDDVLPPVTAYRIPDGALFVAPDGKASNSGSADSPLTVREALLKAPAGGTIVVRGGTYRNVGDHTGHRLTKPVTLQAYPNERPLFNGAVPVTGWVRDGEAWRKDGVQYTLTQSFDKQLGCATPNCFIDPEYPMANVRDMAFIGDQALKQVASRAAVRTGTFFVDHSTDKFYVGSDPGSRAVEISTMEQAFSTSKAAAGSKFLGLGFTRYADTPIEARDAITVEKSSFSWAATVGLQLFGAAFVIRDSRFISNGMQGLKGHYISGTLVEGNLFTGNNVENFRLAWSAAGVKLTGSDQVTARNNRSENNNGAGIWYDGSMTRGLIENNVVRNNKGIGIFYEISDTGEIRGNLAVGNGVGIMLNNTTRTEIHHNTVVDNTQGIYVGDGARKNDKANEIAQGITWEAVGNSVHDNVMSGEKKLFVTCGYKAGAIVTTVDRNVYHLTGERGSVASWHTTGRGCGTQYPTVAAFKAASGKEQSGVQVTSSPFVDAGQGNYQLRDAGMRDRGADTTR